MQFDVGIDGIQQLDKVFRNLPKTTQRKAIMPSLRAGAVVIRNLATENIKSVTKGDGTKVLEKSLTVYNYRKYKGNFRVGIQVKRKLVNTKKIVNGQPVRVGMYAAVLEYGKDGQAPRTWARKAIREGQPQAVSALTKELSARMIDALNEAKK